MTNQLSDTTPEMQIDRLGWAPPDPAERSSRSGTPPHRYRVDPAVTSELSPVLAGGGPGRLHPFGHRHPHRRTDRPRLETSGQSERRRPATARLIVAVGMTTLSILVWLVATSGADRSRANTDTGTDAEMALAADGGDAPDGRTGAGQQQYGDVQPYPFQVVDAVDVSTPMAERRGLAIEINRFPIEREQLIATLDATVLGLAGEAQAVTVRVHHDRREHTPAAYGVWVWAPDGDWDRAAAGDPVTWDGYRWAATFEPGKIDRPDRCRPLAEDELATMAALWPRVWGGDEPDDTIRVDVASAFGLSPERLGEIEAANLEWNRC